MPIYVKIIDNDGVFSGGFARGYCEYYDTNRDIVMKGHFSMNQLIGTGNILIEYTDTTFKYYFGEFKRNKPHGEIILCEFNGNGDLLDFIANTGVHISVLKKKCIYDEGVLKSLISSKTVSCVIDIKYKQIPGIEYMIDFKLKEV